MSREIAKMLAPLSRRLRLMASRAVLSLISDATGMQIVQVKLLNGEVRDGIERVQNYGFTSVPLPGAEAIFLSLGGDRDHGIVITADDRRYRVKGLQGGEVAIYTDEDKAAGEHRILFKRGKEIHLVAGASSIVMTPTGITITTPNLDIVKA
ncbi:MAG: phage baseplate assembly protein V [Pseudomonadota bacterium]